MSSQELLHSADQRLIDLVGTLSPADLQAPSPCSAWTVRSLLSHTVASIDAFAAAVDQQDGPTIEELFSGADILGTDPLAVVKQSVDRSHRAWATIADWERTVTTIIGDMTASEALGTVTYSTLIHSWDLGVAVGRRIEFDDAEAALAQAVGSRLVPPLRPQQLFAQEVEADTQASPTQRVIAFSGRNPL